MRTEARLVIVGAGIVGCSAAYHLALKGWRDIIVVDQGALFETGGSTSYAPGLVFQTSSSKMMTEFAKYTVKLYSDLTYQGVPCFYKVGGIEVVATKERWQDLKRKHGWATSYDLASHLLSPSEVKSLIGLVDENVIYGGYYVPSDGDAHHSWRAAAAMAQKAQELGAAHFYGNIHVTDIEIAKGRVNAVVTDHGRIKSEQVLLCTNIWAPVLGDKIGVPIPLMAVDHQYAITTPLPELAGETRVIVHPILRYQDKSTYYRQHADAYGIGSYNHEPIVVEPKNIGKNALRPFSATDFEAAWNATVKLLPPIAKTDLTSSFNAMFAFSADGKPILGETPNIKNLWTAIGVSVTHSGGVGLAIAEWMSDGVSELDLREANINRFHKYVYSPRYTHKRCKQLYRAVCAIIHPKQQIVSPRNLRLTPFHSRLVAQGGVFFQSGGWEQAQWFEANKHLLERGVPSRTGWEARYWSPIQGAEHLATRENVAMYDLTAFTKIEVSGPSALKYLDYLAANRIDHPIGQVVNTALLNKKGGIRAHLTITRRAGDRFWLLTSGVGMLDLAWIRQHAPTDGSVQITNITSSYCALALSGPKADQVLQSVVEENIMAIPDFTAKAMTIDMIPAFALRVPYAGELGWQLYTSTEYGLRLWDILWEAGQSVGIIAGGGGAFDSLRLEKGERLWGTDIHSEHNPYEAGLGSTICLNKGDFLGRQALLHIIDTGISRKLCCMTLNDPHAVVLGKEPILDGNRKLGYVTSANYGYSIGQFIVYGYLPLDYSTEGTPVEVEYFRRRYAATVKREPLYHPTDKKLKA